MILVVGTNVEGGLLRKGATAEWEPIMCQEKVRRPAGGEDQSAGTVEQGQNLVDYIVREASVTEEQAKQLIERYGEDDPQKLVNYALHLIEDSQPKPGSTAGKI